jgi:hypothetical protein
MTRAFPAPKGHDEKAQGNALGKAREIGQALQGRNLVLNAGAWVSARHGSAPSGREWDWASNPGRCPGLSHFAPLGLRIGRNQPQEQKEAHTRRSRQEEGRSIPRLLVVGGSFPAAQRLAAGGERPTGQRPSAQGCAARAALGGASVFGFNLHGGPSCSRGDATLSGLEKFSGTWSQGGRCAPTLG